MTKVILRRWIGRLLLAGIGTPLFAVAYLIIEPRVSEAIFLSQDRSPPEIINWFMARHDLPASVLAFGHTEGSSEVHAFGTDARGRTIRADHVFHLASLSKPITAKAIRELVEQEKLSLEDRLVEIVPEATAASDTRYRDITIRNLLQHESGMVALNDPMAAVVDFGISEKRSCQPLAVSMLSVPLVFDPGEQQSYSNLGYCWLEVVIERASGLAYADFVRRSISSQFEMNHPFLGAFGGWSATAGEFYNFASQALDDIATQRPSAAGVPDYYGLGWHFYPEETGYAASHFGSWPGAFSIVIRWDSSVAVALFDGRPRNPASSADFLRRALIASLR